MKTELILLGLGVLLVQGAQAHSSCASDGRAAPTTLVERFISADCQACWSEPATDRTPARALTLDWIVPGAQGDDAPLSVAASRDALTRLQTLGRAAPATASTVTTPVSGRRAPQLRVAHGPAFNDYIGASIEMKPAAKGQWNAWLLLVETIPQETDGTPVTRNLVRNLLQSSWNGPALLSKSEQNRFYESRPLTIPAGANPDRLSVVGWVEDTQGRIRSIAQSHCTPVARP